MCEDLDNGKGLGSLLIINWRAESADIYFLRVASEVGELPAGTGRRDPGRHVYCGGREEDKGNTRTAFPGV